MFLDVAHFLVAGSDRTSQQRIVRGWIGASVGSNFKNAAKIGDRKPAVSRPVLSLDVRENDAASGPGPAAFGTTKADAFYPNLVGAKAIKNVFWVPSMAQIIAGHGKPRDDTVRAEQSGLTDFPRWRAQRAEP